MVPELRAVLDAMPSVWSAMTLCSGGHVTGTHGVTACVTPAMPERSLPNSVLYTDPETLVPQLGPLTEIYAEAGVTAWTVWVHPGDADVARLLAERGHVLDAEPAAMVLPDLEALGAPPPVPQGMTIEYPAPAAELGALNDDAYGLTGDQRLAALVAAMDTVLDVHLLRDWAGRAVAGAAVFDLGDDAELIFVATAKAAQRRGFAGLVVHHALLAARARGCALSCLQATKLGEPVYARLGYAAVGNLQMWERREAPLS